MHNPLTKKAREIVWGSLFGDSGIYKSTGSRHYQLKVSHSPKQLGYMKWLEEHLHPLVNKSGISSKTHYHRIRKKKYTTLMLVTTNHSYFTRLRKYFYPEGKKRVRRKMLNKLTPLGLAVWFMDDGTTGKNNRNYPQLNLCTCSFSEKDNQIIKDYFKEEWDIETRIHHSRGFPRIYFNKPNSKKFINIVKKHLIPEMLYKIRYFSQPCSAS